MEENKPDSRAVKSNSSLSKMPNSVSELSEKVKTNESDSVKLSLTKNGKWGSFTKINNDESIFLIILKFDDYNLDE